MDDFRSDAIMPHQIRIPPPPPFMDDVPSPMREVHDLERPPLLHLTVALFIKDGLRFLETTLSETAIPNVNWGHPWLRIRSRFPWQKRPPSEAAFEAVQQLLIANPHGPFDTLGDTYTAYTRIRAQEYLSRFAGNIGANGEEGVLLDRMLPQRLLVYTTERNVSIDDFHTRLSMPFSIGILGEQELEPLLPDTRDEQHAKELNRLRAAFLPHMQTPSASMALRFYPTEIDLEAEQCLFAYEFGLHLASGMEMGVEGKDGREFWAMLNQRADDLVRWAMQAPPDLSSARDSLSPEVVRKVPYPKRDVLRRTFDTMAATQAGHYATTSRLLSYTTKTITVDPGDSHGPLREVHAEGKAAFKSYVATLSRKRGLSDLFAGFVKSSEWAKDQPSKNLEALKKTLYRKSPWKDEKGRTQEEKLWERLWNEAHSISNEKRPPKRKVKRP